RLARDDDGAGHAGCLGRERRTQQPGGRQGSAGGQGEPEKTGSRHRQGVPDLTKVQRGRGPSISPEDRRRKANICCPVDCDRPWTRGASAVLQGETMKRTAGALVLLAGLGGCAGIGPDTAAPWAGGGSNGVASVSSAGGCQSAMAGPAIPGVQ